MNITLTDIKSIELQEQIDNKDSKREISLGCLTYWLGWYNVLQDETYECGRGKNKVETIPAGLYSFDRLSKLLNNDSLTISVSESTGKCTLDVASKKGVLISNAILTLLGFDITTNNRLYSDTYIGTHPVNFALKSLYVYLKQINTTCNLLNGKRSNLLGIVPVRKTTFGESDSVSFQNLVYRKLQSGIINELEIEIRDDNNKIIDNHELPIFIELIIR
jgi:hypothetical protein